MTAIVNNLSKLKMAGAKILGYNEWGVVFQSSNHIVFKNCETNSIYKLPDNSEAWKVVVKKHFICIQYILTGVPPKKSAREALFTRKSNKNVMGRMGERYQSHINWIDYDSKLLIIKKSLSRDIIVLNYKGKRVTYGPSRETFWGDCFLRRSNEGGTKRYLLVNNYDGTRVSEIDIELEKELSSVSS